MTTSATFQTAKGTEIRLYIQTETPNLADHNVMNPCWDLMAQLGDQFPVEVELIDHPEHGLCLTNATLGSEPFLAPVPAAAVEAVRAVSDTYAAEKIRRRAAAEQAADSYEARRDTMRRVLGSACVDE